MACGMAGLHCSPSFMARTSYDPLQFRFSRFSDIPPRYLHIQTKLDSFTKEVPEIKQHYIINILYRFNNLYCALDLIFDVPTLFPPWFQLPDLKKKTPVQWVISQSLSEPTGGWTTPSASPGHGRSCFQTEETGGKSLQFGKELILVGWFSQPMWKVCNRQNGFIFFNFRGEKRTYLKSPTSYRWRFHQDRFETTKRSGPEISGNFRKLRKLKALEVDKSQVLSESWASPKSMQVKKWLLEMSSFQCWSLVRDPEWLRCSTRSKELSTSQMIGSYPNLRQGWWWIHVNFPVTLPGNFHISHLGKFGKSSTQKCWLKTGIC